jgi:UDP-glucose-4-epimerase GalE
MSQPARDAPVLVCGGAGYIGSHTVRHLEEQGHAVVVLDNLSTGHRHATRAPLEVADLADRERLAEVFARHRPRAVMHFAAKCYVGESVENPSKYYRENVLCTWNLLEAMRASEVRTIVFSSTCATYGNPQRLPLTEDHPQVPISPYGRTKLHIEHMLQDYARAYGLRIAALRYFNAAGAARDGSLGEEHEPETHLIPLVLQVALGRRAELTLFGDDYPTPDGTCIRDYVHVEDLARAHEQALLALERGAGPDPGQSRHGPGLLGAPGDRGGPAGHRPGDRRARRRAPRGRPARALVRRVAGARAAGLDGAAR